MESPYHATMNVLTQPKVVLLVDYEKHFFDVYACQLEEFSSLKFIHAESADIPVIIASRNVGINEAELKNLGNRPSFSE